MILDFIHIFRNLFLMAMSFQSFTSVSKFSVMASLTFQKETEWDRAISIKREEENEVVTYHLWVFFHCLDLFLVKQMTIRVFYHSDDYAIYYLVSHHNRQYVLNLVPIVSVNPSLKFIWHIQQQFAKSGQILKSCWNLLQLVTLIDNQILEPGR